MRHRTGIGEAIDIHFKAPLNATSKQASKEEIFYDWRSLGDELELLYKGKFKDYARVQCLKMCHYLKKVRNIEILQMNAQFLKDDTKNIWFSYANNIHYRGSIAKNYGGVDTDEGVNAA